MIEEHWKMIMAQLHIQILPNRAPNLDISSIEQECAALAAKKPPIATYTVLEGDDDGPYVNIDFETSNRSELWNLLRSRLYRHQSFGRMLKIASIAACTGRDSWNDYRLLHHFDPTLRLDEITEP